MSGRTATGLARQTKGVFRLVAGAAFVTSITSAGGRFC